MTEEEAQEKRRRYVETIGALLKNLEKGARALEEKGAETKREDQEECPGEFPVNSTLEEYEISSRGS
jgi:hypothetical protein